MIWCTSWTLSELARLWRELLKFTKQQVNYKSSLLLVLLLYTINSDVRRMIFEPKLFFCKVAWGIMNLGDLNYTFLWTSNVSFCLMFRGQKYYFINYSLQEVVYSYLYYFLKKYYYVFQINAELFFPVPPRGNNYYPLPVPRSWLLLLIKTWSTYCILLYKILTCLIHLFYLFRLS